MWRSRSSVAPWSIGPGSPAAPDPRGISSRQRRRRPGLGDSGRCRSPAAYGAPRNTTNSAATTTTATIKAPIHHHQDRPIIRSSAPSFPNPATRPKHQADKARRRGACGPRHPSIAGNVVVSEQRVALRRDVCACARGEEEDKRDEPDKQRNGDLRHGHPLGFPRRSRSRSLSRRNACSAYRPEPLA